MTTPEAGRLEEITARHEAYVRGESKDTPSRALLLAHQDRAVLLAALTTQAETIRQLEGRIKELEQERDFCAETVQLFQGNEGRETIRRLEGTLATWDHAMQRLEGEVANWKGDFQLACRQRDAAEQRAEAAERELHTTAEQIAARYHDRHCVYRKRAEAAEGRVRELEAERAQHVCRVPILPPRRPHIVLPDDATGEGA